MLDGLPYSLRFLKILGGLISTAAAAPKGQRARVAIFGVCVHLLWAQGNSEGAIQIEKLANQLAETYDVRILCGYYLGTGPGKMDSHIFHRTCAERSAAYSL